VALLGLFTGLLGLAVPLITARLVSFVIPFAERDEAPVLGAMLLGTSAAGALFSYANGITIQRAGFRAGSAALYALWDRLLKLPPAFLAKYSAGDLGQRTAAVDQIRELVAQPSSAAALACPFALVHVVLLVYYRPDVAALALLLPLTMMSFYVVGSIILARQHRARAECQGALSSNVFQTISGNR
jgi:ABC-type bacteriocin/lantibiotic exporter with double-glycine peptidase domain